ncbi:uncharacterized protein FA14DRAFT_158566 [Meira miltonrushii]|uniref:PIN domain-containing protein n=1 Tax=Meira miltonrushii TaxID=1280837 RepID=A0A316V6B5_9BASI|nr:uncharacterized protein FA14DRAFT_158566 [Meira miltonrushii]PWN31753.1 hypothetical protein FA14DRAFT_158566 [Meira miltonrushii]
MPSYADLMAARDPAPSANRGPVRLWISRGEVRKALKEREYVEEIWQEEEIMDTDTINIPEDDSGYSSAFNNDVNGLSRDSFASSLASLGKGNAGVLLVLDTNTLLDALPFCTTMFTQCLARNAHAMSLGRFTVSPISFIVPKVVVGELDNLKTRDKTRDRAQRANKWILETIIQQKRRTYTLPNAQQNQVELLPENAWALHIENNAHYIKCLQDPLYRGESPDDEIVSLCSILQRDSGQTAWLCSDDINAKLRAESEGIMTFSISKWIKDEVGFAREGKDESLSKSISEMIDQWIDQMGIQSTNLSGQSQDFGSPTQSSSMTIDSPPTSPNSDPRRSPKQGLNDSMHAVSNYTYQPRRNSRPQNGTSRYPSRTQHSMPNTHVYSATDRTSGSSMWASKP